MAATRDNSQTSQSDKTLKIPSKDFHIFLASFLKFKDSVSGQFKLLNNKIDRIEGYMVTNPDVIEPPVGESKNVFPLATIEETLKFENDLVDEEYKKKSIKTMKRFIGTGQRWKQASYRLSSFIFTKELLTLFSWTGKSKTSDAKEPFGRLVHILDVFFTVVSLSDPTFSHVQLEEFFKDGILKHSKTRLNASKKKGARDYSEMSQDNTFIITTCDQQFIDIEDRVEAEVVDIPFDIKTEDYNV